MNNYLQYEYRNQTVMLNKMTEKSQVEKDSDEYLAKSKMNVYFAAVLLIIFLSIIIYSVYIINKNPSPSVVKEEIIDNSFGAWLICQEFVERELGSPSTANFPSDHRNKFPSDYRNKVKPVNNDTYLVAAYVDSKNQLGSELRSTFSCKVKLSEGTWELVSLTIQ